MRVTVLHYSVTSPPARFQAPLRKPNLHVTAAAAGRQCSASTTLWPSCATMPWPPAVAKLSSRTLGAHSTCHATTATFPEALGLPGGGAGLRRRGMAASVTSCLSATSCRGRRGGGCPRTWPRSRPPCAPQLVLRRRPRSRRVPCLGQTRWAAHTAASRAGPSP